MDNDGRRKEYKRLWYQKQQAKKHGNMLKYEQIELELDDFREEKKHDPKYDLHKKIVKQKRYNKYRKTGFFTKSNRKWRKNHPKHYKAYIKRQWQRIKSNPKLLKKHQAFERKYHRVYYANNKKVNK